jgi:hypothetical protein
MRVRYEELIATPARIEAALAAGPGRRALARRRSSRSCVRAVGSARS